VEPFTVALIDGVPASDHEALAPRVGVPGQGTDDVLAKA
jgi:hypothetical protein